MKIILSCLLALSLVGCASTIRTRVIGAGLCKTKWNDDVRFLHPTDHEDFKCQCSQLTKYKLPVPTTDWMGNVVETEYLSCPIPAKWVNEKQPVLTEEMPTVVTAAPAESVLPAAIHGLSFMAGLYGATALFPRTEVTNTTNVRASTINP